MYWCLYQSFFTWLKIFFVELYIFHMIHRHPGWCRKDLWKNNAASSALFLTAGRSVCLGFKKAFLWYGQGNKHIVMAKGSWPEIQRSQQAAEPGKLTFLAASLAWGAEQRQTVTWVWLEWINSELASTVSRHTAFITIRRQQRFEASGQADQASRHVLVHYSFCSQLWKEPLKTCQPTDEENTALYRQALMNSL